MVDSPRARRLSVFAPLMLLGIAVVYLAARVRWTGHLLMWDEAMNLCAVRALAAGGYDWYSYWIWRYPPLFNTLLLLARPLQDGFMARAAWLPVLSGLATLPVLFLLNQRVFGRRVALWSCLVWSLLPASVFFGVWIKQDVLVPFFGLLALYLFIQRRPGWSGLALGLAFLTKEMALFYALALALLALWERRYRELGLVALLAFLASAWWFVFFSESVRFFASYAVGSAPAGDAAWQKPWTYCFLRLPDDLGWLGLGLALGALLPLLHVLYRVRPGSGEQGDRAVVWPLALLVPAYLILTLAQGKTPWYAMTLLPAWATLTALGLDLVSMHAPYRSVRVAVGVAFAVALSVPLWGRDYEVTMETMEPGMWWASSASREAAETLNRVTRDGEQALITPMHYYDASFTVPCPIFVAYLKPLPVLVRANTLPAEQLVKDARELRLAWAMVSPPPESGEQALLWPLMRQYGLRPLWLRGACVFRTRDLWSKEP